MTKDSDEQKRNRDIVCFLFTMCFFRCVVKSTCLLCFVFLSFLYWLNFVFHYTYAKRIRCIQTEIRIQNFSKYTRKKSIRKNITKKIVYCQPIVLNCLITFHHVDKRHCYLKISFLSKKECDTFELYIKWKHIIEKYLFLTEKQTERQSKILFFFNICFIH